MFIIFLMRLESISLVPLPVQRCCRFIMLSFLFSFCASLLHSDTIWLTFSPIFHTFCIWENQLLYLCNVFPILFAIIDLLRLFSALQFLSSDVLFSSVVSCCCHKYRVISFLSIVLFALLQ